jgi:hypothetical protein
MHWVNVSDGHMVNRRNIGGEPHSASYYRVPSNSCATSFGPIGLLAAAPWSVGQASGCATFHGVARFSGRRGCGTRKTLIQVFGRGQVDNPHTECNAPPIGWWTSSRHPSRIAHSARSMLAQGGPVRRARCLLRAGPFDALNACSGRARSTRSMLAQGRPIRRAQGKPIRRAQGKPFTSPRLPPLPRCRSRPARDRDPFRQSFPQRISSGSRRRSA